MGLYDELVNAGAKKEMEENTAWAVSFWTLEFEGNPETHVLFYDNENKDAVKKVIARWNYPPEMPLVTDIDTHRMIVESLEEEETASLDR